MSFTGIKPGKDMILRMTKKAKTLIICGAAVVVLVGVLLVLLLTGNNNDPNENTSSESESVAIVNKNKTDVSTLKIENEKETYTIAGGTGKWTIASLKGYDTSTDLFESTVDTACALNASKLVEQSAPDLKKYGLDKPAAKYTLTFNDKSTLTVHFGDQSGDKLGYYAKLDNSGDVYVVDTAYSSAFFEGRLYYIKLGLTEDKPEDSDTSSTSSGTSVKKYPVTRLEVTRNDLDKPIRLVLGDTKLDDDTPQTKSFYGLESPFRAELDTEKTDEYVDALYGLMAESVVALDYEKAGGKAKYGFDKPTMVVNATVDGKPLKLTVGRNILCSEYQDKATSVESGHQHQTVAYYLLLNDSKVLYTISPDSLPWLTTSVKDILSPAILMPYIDSLSGMEIKTDKTTYTIRFSGTGNDLNPVINGAAVDTDKFQNFYAFLISAEIDDINTTKVTASPTLTINYKYRDKSKKNDVVAFAPHGERKVAAAVNGEYNFILRSAFVDKVYSNLKLIAENQEIDKNY